MPYPAEFSKKGKLFRFLGISFVYLLSFIRWKISKKLLESLACRHVLSSMLDMLEIPKLQRELLRRRQCTVEAVCVCITFSP